MKEREKSLICNKNGDIQPYYIWWNDYNKQMKRNMNQVYLNAIHWYITVVGDRYMWISYYSLQSLI